MFSIICNKNSENTPKISSFFSSIQCGHSINDDSVCHLQIDDVNIALAGHILNLLVFIIVRWFNLYTNVHNFVHESNISITHINQAVEYFYSRLYHVYTSEFGSERLYESENPIFRDNTASPKKLQNAVTGQQPVLCSLA